MLPVVAAEPRSSAGPHLTQQQKQAICNEAKAAWGRHHTPLIACPYPFKGDAGYHWLACWILAGGTLS